MLKVDMSIDLSKAIKQFSDANIKRGMYAMANQMLSDMTNYVPLKDSGLRQSGHVESEDTLAWDTPYAAAQYHGTAGKKKGFVSDKQRRFFFWALNNGGLPSGYTTAGTGPHWDEVAKGKHMNDWTDAFVKGAGFRA